MENHVIKISEEEIENEEVERVEKYNDDTEKVYNRSRALERLILKKCKSLNVQHVLMASMVDNVAADALTSLCLGLGRNLSQSAVLSQKYDDVTILVRTLIKVTNLVCLFRGRSEK